MGALALGSGGSDGLMNSSSVPFAAVAGFVARTMDDLASGRLAPRVSRLEAGAVVDLVFCSLFDGRLEILGLDGVAAREDGCAAGLAEDTGKYSLD